MITEQKRYPGQAKPADIWVASHAPAANTKATATKAAAGAGIRNIITAIVVTLAAGSTAPAATTISVSAIDGASGGTTYLWGPFTLSIPAVAGALNGIAIPVWIPGSPNTATTIEFSGAAGVNTVESVWMSGEVRAD